jgi:hypothetical protein
MTIQKTLVLIPGMSDRQRHLGDDLWVLLLLLVGGFALTDENMLICFNYV